MVHYANPRSSGGERPSRRGAEDADGGVRSLVRGLDLLAALNERNPATVSELTQATGLPKATVIRLLKTLCAEGYVARLAGGEGYRLTPQMRRLTRALHRENELFHVARPVLYELLRRTLWPLQLLIADGDSMVIEVGTRHVAPLTIRGLETTRFPIVGSAAGLVHLAWLPAEARAELLARLARSGGPQASLAGNADAIRRQIAEVRGQGYSARTWTAITGRIADVAVPVMVGDRSVASLCLECLDDAVEATDLARRFVPLLRDGAAAIADGLGRPNDGRG
jgi:IclR family mhp operon transcriptional activator